MDVLIPNLISSVKSVIYCGSNPKARAAMFPCTSSAGSVLNPPVVRLAQDHRYFFLLLLPECTLLDHWDQIFSHTINCQRNEWMLIPDTYWTSVMPRPFPVKCQWYQLDLNNQWATCLNYLVISSLPSLILNNRVSRFTAMSQILYFSLWNIFICKFKMSVKDSNKPKMNVSL